MYCLFCGSSLPEDAMFCLKCGQSTPKGSNEYGGSKPDAPTLASVSSPSDPYSPRASTNYGSYGELPTEAAVLNPYESQIPLPPPPPPLKQPSQIQQPPQKRRSSSGFLKGLVVCIIVILLSIGATGTLLLFNHQASSLATANAVRATSTAATARATAQHASEATATAQTNAQNSAKATSTATANGVTQGLPGTWTQCAAENATCQFTGTMTVAFGANGSYNYTTGNNEVACNNTTFGDPLNGTVKACYMEAAPPAANVWIQCAAENANCSFTGTMTVAFGANGAYKYATESNGVACTDAVFGDPIYGTGKACYLLAPPASAATWNTCATENNTCTFMGTHEVAYGANGQYFYKSFTSGTACNNTVFGDPASGAAKTCYYQ